MCISPRISLSECARTCSACARHTCTAAADAYTLPGVRESEMWRLTSCGQCDPRGYPAAKGGSQRRASRCACHLLRPQVLSGHVLLEDLVLRLVEVGDACSTPPRTWSSRGPRNVSPGQQPPSPSSMASKSPCLLAGLRCATRRVPDMSFGASSSRGAAAAHFDAGEHLPDLPAVVAVVQQREEHVGRERRQEGRE